MRLSIHHNYFSNCEFSLHRFQENDFPAVFLFLILMGRLKKKKTEEYDQCKFYALVYYGVIGSIFFVKLPSKRNRGRLRLTQNDKIKKEKIKDKQDLALRTLANFSLLIIRKGKQFKQEY